MNFSEFKSVLSSMNEIIYFDSNVIFHFIFKWLQ